MARRRSMRTERSIGRVDRRRLAGAALAAGGIVVTLGITVAGTLYPGYSIHAQTISDLGARADSGVLVQPAATVFTLSMALAGVLVALAGALGRSALDRRLAGGLLATGAGISGVALFPAHVGWPHAIAALVAFAGGGLTALVAGWVTVGWMRGLSATLGATTLLALGAFLVLGGSTPLGVGGLERLVSLPIQCWAICYGGWLLGGADRSAGG